MTKILTLTTDIPEFAAYIEYYNSTQNRQKIQLQYTDAPALSLQSKNQIPDLIIYENLATPQLLPFFAPLDDLLSPEKIPKERFYKGILEGGVYKEKQVLLPLAFSLPMISFKSENLDEDMISLIIDLESVKTKSLAFFPKDTKKQGFSPFWNDEFLLTTAIAMGSLFTVSSSNNLTWDESALDSAVTFLSEWIDDLPGGVDSASEFRERYMNIPAYRLLIQEKILYYYSDSKYLNSIPVEIRKGIDFRWLTYENKIPVPDNMLYIGISEKSDKKKAAKAFLKWLFNPVVQSRLLETNNYKRMTGIFGLANNFSSIIEVNEKYIPQNHPFMVSHIPESDYLLFPGLLPDNWQEIRKKIIKEWFPASLLETETKIKLENLLNF